MSGVGEESSMGKSDGKTDVEWAEKGDYVILEDKNSKLKMTLGRSALEILEAPWVVWTAFVISILAGSSAAAVTVWMHRAAPISLAGWRQQVSALIMLPGFLWERSRLPKCDRQKMCTPRNLCLHFICALALSAHFGTYLWGLSHTSITHCLFLLSMSPVFVAIYTKLVGGVLRTGEIIGVILGICGVTILGLGTKVEQDNVSSNIGDLLSLSAAVSMATYLIVGRNLRSWMPLFVYQFPVAFLSSIILGVAGLLIEGWNESDTGDISGPFSWLRKEYFLGTIFLGLGPGFIGHAGYSFVLKYLSPLVLPTGLSLQPIIGSAIGWIAGQSPTPGLWTCIGGAVELGGTLSISCASVRRKEKLETKEKDYQQPAADEEGQQESKTSMQPSDLSHDINEPLLPNKAQGEV